MKTLLRLMEDIVAVHEAYRGGDEKISNQGQALDGYSALANYDALAVLIKEELENL